MADDEIIETRIGERLPVELIVSRIIDIWSREPRLRQTDMTRRVRETFGCGFEQSEDLIHQARLAMADAAADPALTNRVVAKYWDIFAEQEKLYQLSLSKEKWTNARMCLENMRETLTRLAKHLGLDAAIRVEVTGPQAVKSERYADLTADELMLLTKIDYALAPPTTTEH